MSSHISVVRRNLLPKVCCGEEIFELKNMKTDSARSLTSKGTSSSWVDNDDPSREKTIAICSMISQLWKEKHQLFSLPMTRRANPE